MVKNNRITFFHSHFKKYLPAIHEKINTIATFHNLLNEVRFLLFFIPTVQFSDIDTCSCWRENLGPYVYQAGALQLSCYGQNSHFFKGTLAA